VVVSLLYVRPECGDVGCGAIAVRISRSGDVILRRDFARENGRDAPIAIDARNLSLVPPHIWNALSIADRQISRLVRHY
jgi:hypothetical protein